ncbi:hypothetical protein C4D60_Mb05t19310 [Musa balbisiana]|uniref:Uncharacterized protein n=1 Tax=Musa balbisiana TaxID=52838 RepID=A0A4V4H899_MUSBA|nr:hypothetical protein C4D60_Mb05t19310 [Musa balbisiana]
MTAHIEGLKRRLKSRTDEVDLLDGGKEHRWMGPNRHAKELLKAGKPGSRSSGIRNPQLWFF